MDKTKLLFVCVGVLVVLNLALLFKVYSGGAHRLTDGHRNRELIIDKLHFDRKQVEKYDALIEWHQTQIRRYDAQARHYKQQLYATLQSARTDQKMTDSLITLLGENQENIEKTHLKHFKDIKALCRKDQLAAFDELSHGLASMFGKPMPPRP